MWFGEGRWDWDTLYNLPVPLRRFWQKKLDKILRARYERQENPTTSAENNKPKIAKGPF